MISLPTSRLAFTGTFCGGCDLTLFTGLQRIDDTQDLIKVASNGHCVGHGQPNLPVRGDYEHGSDSGRFTLTGMDHIIELRDPMIRISDDWKGKVGIFRIIDIVNPLDVRLRRSRSKDRAVLCRGRQMPARAAWFGPSRWCRLA